MGRQIDLSVDGELERLCSIAGSEAAQLRYTITEWVFSKYQELRGLPDKAAKLEKMKELKITAELENNDTLIVLKSSEGHIKSISLNDAPPAANPANSGERV